ncbi:MAG: hypothetical protein IJ763_06475 [Lachnospiraceae bacterium]|nr:hypothetical protein [Lachnospiraceae bacterium]
MYFEFAKWLDRILDENMTIEGVGIVFNLYEDVDLHWSIQLTSTSYYDEDDEDWKCDEAFTSGEDLYTWKQDTGWEEILDISIDVVKKYLDEGKYSKELKNYKVIGIGFVDGDLEILYLK